MTCKYCNGKLAPLRSLTDGEFCRDEHRDAYSQEQARLLSQPVQPLGVGQDGISAAGAAPAADATVPPDTVLSEAQAAAAMDTIRKKKLGSWGWLVTAWKGAPFELKALAVLLPILVGLMASPHLHQVRAHFQNGDPADLRVRTRKALAEQWKGLSQRISNRAAIAITDDFRSGLDFWESRSNLTKSWSFDSNGFVQPGPLAILTPTQDLTDYSFEFLGEIEQKGMGAAFRARDLDNYYAIQFVRDDSDAMPALRMIRYPVVQGKQGPHVETAVPSPIRADRMNRFRVETHGNDFTILVEGQVVDSFSDSRLKSGGIGFFCARGEKARLRWVEVSHQYDTLGKVCAYFAPLNLTGIGKD